MILLPLGAKTSVLFNVSKNQVNFELFGISTSDSVQSSILLSEVQEVKKDIYYTSEREITKWGCGRQFATNCLGRLGKCSSFKCSGGIVIRNESCRRVTSMSRMKPIAPPQHQSCERAIS